MAFSEDDIHRYVDGRLEPATARLLEAALAADDELRARVEAWTAQRRALGDLGRDILAEPVPAPMLAALADADGASGPGPAAARGGAGTGRRWLAAASIALAAGALGFAGGRATVPTPARVAGPAAVTPSAGGAPGFVRDGLAAHVTFTPEVRHPVEVTAADRTHLMAWLTKRLGTRIAAPALEALGYELVGGRLLPGEQGPSALFMYQDASGRRVTLYVARRPGDASMTAFRFERTGSLEAFYWIDRDLGYVLSGEVGRERLAEMATAVHREFGS